MLAGECDHDMTRQGVVELEEPANSSVLAEMVAMSSRPADLRSSPASMGTGRRPTALVMRLSLPVQDPLDGYGAPVPAAAAAGTPQRFSPSAI
jgi:hypothetical protein